MLASSLLAWGVLAAVSWAANAADPRVGPVGMPSRSAFTVDGVATWRGNATGAYSIIHDDVCADRVKGIFIYAAPELSKRGLHAGFGALAGECERHEMWGTLKGLIAQGHDVFSHSWSHPCMTADDDLASSCDPAFPRSTNYSREIDQAAAIFRSAAGVASDFFAFPFDVCDPAALERLRSTGFLGARCGERGINSPTFTDSFTISFDVWGPAHSVYYDASPCRGIKQYETSPAQASAACRTYVINQLVDDAVAQKGWAVRAFHGFDGDVGVWQPLAPAEYAAHLDYVLGKVNAGALWVEGPTPVLKYRWARERCALPAIRRKNTLVFAAPAVGCTRYATTLSYLVSTTDGSDPASLAVHQAGVMLPARKLGKGRFAVDADPTKGEAVLVE